MNRVAIVIGGVALAVASLAVSANTLRVTEVIDGDTVRVQRGTTVHTVRIIGIDAPELHHPSEPPQFLASESSAALSEMVTNRSVRLVADDRAGVDRFGRELSYLELEDGTDLGAQLISQGLARVFTKFPFERKARYLALEQAARKAGRGVWADGGLAEVLWLSSKHEAAIEVIPLSAARFAVKWNSWIRLGVSSKQLPDAVWTVRRAAGMLVHDPSAAAEALATSGFQHLSAADPAPSPRPPAKDPARRPGSHPRSRDRIESD